MDPRASGKPAASAVPQQSDRGAGVPGIPPAWQRVLEIWATPELFVLEVLRPIWDGSERPYAFPLRDPTAGDKIVRQLTDGHPIPRR